MTPCRSGNSPTIAVSRSHLHSSAARRVSSTGPLMAMATSVASAAMRRVLSPSEPSFTWKVTASSPRRRAEGLTPILFEEKHRIGEPRAYHALVPLAHLGGIAALDVADRNEGGLEGAGAVLHREVTLVSLQRGDQHLARQREEARLEAPGECHRPLDERGDLLEQVLLDEGAAPERGGKARDLGADAFAALHEVCEHPAALPQRALVGARARDPQGLGRVEAVPVG